MVLSELSCTVGQYDGKGNILLFCSITLRLLNFFSLMLLNNFFPDREKSV